MTTSPPARFVVVVALDASPDAANVLAQAVASIRERPNAHLHLVHCVDMAAWGLTPLVDPSREYLDELVGRATAMCPETRLSSHLRVGRPWREIVQLATSLEANLVVVGTHGRTGAPRILLGSEAELVVRRAPCPVLVVRQSEHGSREVPEIEPACPNCVEVQRSTAGEKLWCAQHAEHHPRPHRHYEFPTSFGLGSQLTRPE
jgi:nucleotide-binding universal stress UspA family protein